MFFFWEGEVFLGEGGGGRESFFCEESFFFCEEFFL